MGHDELEQAMHYGLNCAVPTSAAAVLAREVERLRLKEPVADAAHAYCASRLHGSDELTSAGVRELQETHDALLATHRAMTSSEYHESI